MKKLLWGTALMVVCLFSACSDDDDDKIPQGPSITYAGKLPTQIGNYTFVYDDNNRCTQVKEGSYVLGEIDYDKGILITDGDEETNVTFKDGYIAKISASWNYSEDGYSSKGSGTISFSYKDDRLVSYSENFQESGQDEGEKYFYNGTYKTVYTWKNGNLVKAETKEEETEDGEKYEAGSTYTIEYGDEKNELGQYTLGLAAVLDMEDADVFALVGMLGKASAYFPVSYTEKWYEKDSEYNHEGEDSGNMSYDFNPDKTVETEYFHGMNTYRYFPVDDNNLSSKATSAVKSLNLRSFFMRHRERR